MIYFRGLFLGFCMVCVIICGGQSSRQAHSAEIFQAIQKLQFLGSVLYVAAHPDDENTRLISYLSNHVKAHTAYLSLTRGGGGQNRIGPEIREALGLIRTHELMEARAIDGGEQYFSRANDFGYSKHPDETFAIWDKQEILSDVIWVIRNFKPDIIINRFDHRTPGRGHGHHTGSAILAYEAFDQVNQPTVFADQLEFATPWQPRRLFFNTSWWFYGSKEAFQKADKSQMVSIDVGVYSPLTGKSNTEIAAESRTMHKSQGFGSTGTRGSHLEYLELIKGDPPSDLNNLFEGINTSWTRIEGGKLIGEILEQLENDFDFENPSASIPLLMTVRNLILNLQDSYWKSVKLKELNQLIENCLGLYLEATGSQYTAVPGDDIEISIEATNRSGIEIQLEKISWGIEQKKDSSFHLTIKPNTDLHFELNYKIPENQAFSSPYWLKEEGSLGHYQVGEQQNIGIPRMPKAIQVNYDLKVQGQPIAFQKELVFKTNDPVKGAVYRPFEIIPAISVEMEQDVYIFPNQSPRNIQVSLTAGADDLSGLLSLEIPDDWRTIPENMPFYFEQKDEVKQFDFKVYPPEASCSIEVIPSAKIGSQKYQERVQIIDYDHIPYLTMTRPSRAKFVKMDLRKLGSRLVYIEGSGDAIPSCLRQLGYTVDVIEVDEITEGLLSSYDACIVGIRAYNLKESIKFKQKLLMDYVEKGGTLIIQYNTSRGLKVDDLGPYPFKLSRDRVTVEEAEIRILAPDHLALNYPNKISAVDFDSWVQERGLYFPNEWDKQYTALLSSNDPGETPKDGGLLITKFGKGYYVYTSYSWFRQLPAGVVGAYRIFINLISLGQTVKP